MRQVADHIQVVAETLWRERPESQRWLPVAAFQSLAETVVIDLIATQLEEEVRELYVGWGRNRQRKGAHRRYVTEWESIE